MADNHQLSGISSRARLNSILVTNRASRCKYFQAGSGLCISNEEGQYKKLCQMDFIEKKKLMQK